MFFFQYDLFVHRINTVDPRHSQRTVDVEKLHTTDTKIDQPKLAMQHFRQAENDLKTY